MNEQTYCKKQGKGAQYIERQKRWGKVSTSTPLRSIEAINTPVEYIDQEHFSHLPFEVKPNAEALL